jgi:hypothetical protein
LATQDCSERRREEDDAAFYHAAAEGVNAPARRRREALDGLGAGALYSLSIEMRVAAASCPDAEASHGEAGDRLQRKSGAVPQL